MDPAIDNLLIILGRLSIDVATVSVLKTVPTLEAAAVEVKLLAQLPLEPSDKSGVLSPVEGTFGLSAGFELGITALNVDCTLDIRESCKLCRIGLELRGEGLDKGCDSKMCTCRSRSYATLLGIATAPRLICFGGTPTLREAAGGEVESSACMCASTSGMDITATVIYKKTTRWATEVSTHEYSRA